MTVYSVFKSDLDLTTFIGSCFCVCLVYFGGFFSGGGGGGLKGQCICSSLLPTVATNESLRTAHNAQFSLKMGCFHCHLLKKSFAK